MSISELLSAYAIGTEQREIELYNGLYLLSQKLDAIINKVSNIEALINPPAPDTDRLFSLKEAAACLKVSVPTLRNYITKGLIATTQLSKGCNLKFKKSDLDAYLSNTRKKTKAEITEIANNLLNGGK